MEGILGKDVRIVQPPLSMSRSEKPPLYHRTRSDDGHERRPLEQALVAEGVHREVDPDNYSKSVFERSDTAIAYSHQTPKKQPSDHEIMDTTPASPTTSKRILNAQSQNHRPIHAATAPMPIEHSGRGQAHNPLSDHLYLALGPGGSSAPPSPPAVSESPPAAESDIYETAFHAEIERIRTTQGKSATLFMTRRVEHKEQYQKDEGLIKGDHGKSSTQKSGFARVLDQARIKAAKGGQSGDDGRGKDTSMADAPS